MVRKFSYCSNLYADVIANVILLHIFINLKIVFNLGTCKLRNGKNEKKRKETERKKKTKRKQGEK